MAKTVILSRSNKDSIRQRSQKMAMKKHLIRPINYFLRSQLINLKQLKRLAINFITFVSKQVSGYKGRGDIFLMQSTFHTPIKLQKKVYCFMAQKIGHTVYY